MNTRLHLPQSQREIDVLDQLRIREIISKHHTMISGEISEALEMYHAKRLAVLTETRHGLILSEMEYVFDVNEIFESVIKRFFLEKHNTEETISKATRLYEQSGVHNGHAKMLVIDVIAVELAYNRKISLSVREKLKKYWV